MRSSTILGFALIALIALAAWGNVLDNLRKRFDTGQPQDWTAWLEQLKRLQPPAK